MRLDPCVSSTRRHLHLARRKVFPTFEEVAMTNVLRWVAELPAALISFVAVFMLPRSLRGLLLRLCSSVDRRTEWTTDLSWPGPAVGVPGCSAGRFPGVEMGLLAFTFAAAVIAAGCVAAWIAPARKVACGVSAAGVAVLHRYVLSRL